MDSGEGKKLERREWRVDLTKNTLYACVKFLKRKETLLENKWQVPKSKKEQASALAQPLKGDMQAHTLGR